MKKVSAMIAILLLLVLSFSACGDKDNKNDINNITENEISETDVQKGGYISIYSYKPDTLCPLLSHNSANVKMLGIVFDGLFTVDENLSVSPCIASSWVSSADNKEYTVELKKNVMFHDGSLLNAEDVVFSVNTALSDPSGPFYHNVSVIKEVRALGSDHVLFVLSKPLSRFVNLLDFPIIKKQAEPVDKDSFSPIGTGGFIFEDRNEGNLLHLVKNNNWWGGEVYLDSVRVRLLPDKDTAVYAFSSGEISLCPAENDEWGKFVDVQTAYHKEYMTEYYNFMGLNHKSSVFSDEEVRKALLYVIDRQEVLKSGAPGFSEASNAPFKKNWIYLSEDKSEEGKNLNKARELLEGGGWELSGGVYKKSDARGKRELKFEILINEESYKREQFAKKISEQLLDFGIPTEVKKLPFEQYANAIAKGNYDMFIGSMNLSKELDFEFLFSAGNMFSSEDEELLLSAINMQLAADEEEFGIRATEFIRLFNDKVPFIGIGFENSVLLYKSEINGSLTPVSNNIYNGIEKLYIKKES